MDKRGESELEINRNLLYLERLMKSMKAQRACYVKIRWAVLSKLLFYSADYMHALGNTQAHKHNTSDTAVAHHRWSS